MSGSTAPTRQAHEVMHRGVINTPPQTPLQEVAAEMADHRVHCVVVEGLARGRHRQEDLVWGILSDLDLVKAAVNGPLDMSAGDVAATEIVTVEASDSVEEVMRTMAEHECAHLIVVSPKEGEPLGVISSLDLAGVIAEMGESAL